MKILRTPDKYFKNIKGYPFDPIYTNINAEDGSKIRVHHIDEGPSDGPTLLAMHGQPVWSYLYSRMIPILNESGIGLLLLTLLDMVNLINQHQERIIVIKIKLIG